MKFNKWTLGLAALGVVSIGSVARAEEAQMNAVQTALASTVISGYVDTSLEWQIDPDHGNFDDNSSWPYIPFREGNNSDKRNGFNLNVVKLSIEKAMDESEWASGYKVDLLFGPDAVAYNPSSNGDTTSDFAIKQAYVALRTPLGNGIDWKMGVFDTIIGYESFDAGNNPNFTRSYGYAIEPTQHTGLLGTYRINDNFSFSAGLANTHMAGINVRDSELADGQSEWRKTWMASMAYTTSDSAGALSGSTFYLGAVGGFAGGTTDQINYYAGATLGTPVAGLKLGLALDYASNLGGNEGDGLNTYEDNAWVAGLYASWQCNEKMSLHLRGEYGNLDYDNDGGDSGDETMWGLTATLQYNLWNNVISRLEARYDKVTDDDYSSVEDTHLGVYLNVIYKF
jgi:hypothetical protein